MRVKFGDNRIKLCVNITLLKDTKLLIITTYNREVITVNMLTPENAENNFKKLLELGYCDISDYEYRT